MHSSTNPSVAVLALPFRGFISPPTKRRRRGQQAEKNHRGVLFDFTVAILVFAEGVLALPVYHLVLTFTLSQSRDFFTHRNCRGARL